MKRNITKLLSVLLAIVLVVGLLPATALAWAVYDVWVSGVQVTGLNADDVLEDGGSVVFTSATGIFSPASAGTASSSSASPESRGCASSGTSCSGSSAVDSTHNPTDSDSAILSSGFSVKATEQLPICSTSMIARHLFILFMPSSGFSVRAVSRPGLAGLYSPEPENRRTDYRCRTKSLWAFLKISRPATSVSTLKKVQYR